MTHACVMCLQDGGTVLLRGVAWRIVLARDEPLYPGLCRVIWNEHVREMTDLEPAARREFFAAVLRTESAVRRVLHPAKVNLASLGNVTPHLHWHVVPRNEQDAHFPNAIWGPERRNTTPHALDEKTVRALKAAVEEGT